MSSLNDDAQLVPELSYVVVTDSYATIRGVLDRIRRQTIRDQIEVVLVAPTTEAVSPALAWRDEVAGLQIVEHPADSLALARAAGIRAAKAPVVFIGETHSYPHPGMAEALLVRSKQGPWTVIVPGFGNANPNGPLSEAGFLSDYGAWVASMPAGEITDYPIYNAAFRRSALVELGGRLDTALAHGDALCIALREKGARVFLEPAARLDHVNVAPLGHWVRERFLSGMVIARHRSTDWDWSRRLLYLLASPLIAGVLFWRVLPGVRSAAGKSGLGVRTWLLILLGMVVKAAGEARVYAGGWSESAELQMHDYEMHKLAYAGREASR